MSQTQDHILQESADILKTEADQLARFLTSIKVRFQRVDINTDESPVPHRVSIAIRNEMERLQHLAKGLEAMKGSAEK